MERRGTNGWGFAALRPFEHELDYLRCETRISESLDCHIFGAYHSMILHTRAMTTGAHVIHNNHPFAIGKIVGAHNGVVYNHEVLKTKYGRDFAVDSMHIFAHLDENRPVDDISTYGALEWYNIDNPHRINLVRIHEGSLEVVRLSYGGQFIGVAWASQMTPLKESARMAGFGVSSYQEPAPNQTYFAENGQLWELEKGIHKFGPRASKATCNVGTTGFYGGYEGYQYEGYRGNKDTRVVAIVPKTLTAVWADMKPIVAYHRFQGVEHIQCCASCGVYYQELEAPNCYFCGVRTDYETISTALEQYSPAEPYMIQMLRQGAFTPPLNKRTSKKYAGLLEEMLVASEANDLTASDATTVEAVEILNDEVPVQLPLV
jgi:predicted glutamine amidotransferase